MLRLNDLRELLTEFADQRGTRSSWGDYLLFAATCVILVVLGLFLAAPGSLVELAVTASILVVSACYFRWPWVGVLIVVGAIVPLSVGQASYPSTAIHVVCRIVLLGCTAGPTLLLGTALRRAVSISDHDRLTGLLNRTGFLKQLESESNRAARSGWPIAVGFLDCDNFKQVNDKFGHLAGDEVLQLTSSVIAENIRNYDAAARFGGDEFVMLWPVLSAAGGEDAARRLHEILTRRMVDAGWSVTFSLGVAVFESIPDTDTILGKADALMYDVKNNGKGGLKVQVFRDEEKIKVG